MLVLKGPVEFLLASPLLQRHTGRYLQRLHALNHSFFRLVKKKFNSVYVCMHLYLDKHLSIYIYI